MGQYVVVHPTDPMLIGIDHEVLKGAPVQIDRIVKVHGADLSSLKVAGRRTAYHLYYTSWSRFFKGVCTAFPFWRQAPQATFSTKKSGEP